MADEFVEVVNTTVTSTELPNNSTKYTLKTAGAAESFAIKDIGIENASSLNGFDFYINDFKSISFAAGESGVASGLDLLPKNGTLKVRGTSFPIDSSTLVVSKTDGSAPKKLITTSFITETSRPTSKYSLNKNKYSETETFSYTGGTNTTNRTFAVFSWRNGTKFRRHIRKNGDWDVLEYADSTSISTISNTYKSIDYDIVNEKIYALNSSGVLYVADATANISFSSVTTAPTGTWSGDAKIWYLDGLIWAIEGASTNPPVYVFDPTSGYVHYFGGSKSNQGSWSASESGFCVSYDPATDTVYFFNSGYNTSDPHYISRHACPVTVTQIKAYTSNQQINTNWVGSWQQFTRSSPSVGPFGYAYGQFMRGSSTNPNIFYISDSSQATSNDNVNFYWYDWNTNTLSSMIDLDHIGSGNETVPLWPVERPVNAADEFILGGSPDSSKIRVTAIKTT